MVANGGKLVANGGKLLTFLRFCVLYDLLLWNLGVINTVVENKRVFCIITVYFVQRTGYYTENKKFLKQVLAIGGSDVYQS